MIHNLGVLLQADLRTRGCPLPVVDGPEGRKGQAMTFVPERIVLERAGGDGYSPGKGTNIPGARRAAWFRDVGVKATIYVKSPRAGATTFEHYERAEHVLDMVITSLEHVCKSDTIRAAYALTGGEFLVPEDLETTERPNGAAYELRFSINRGISVETWAGAGPVTTTVGDVDGVTVSTTTRVSLDGDDFENV